MHGLVSEFANSILNFVQVELKHTVEILHDEQERVVKIEAIKKSLEVEVKVSIIRQLKSVHFNRIITRIYKSRAFPFDRICPFVLKKLKPMPSSVLDVLSANWKLASRIWNLNWKKRDADMLKPSRS